MTCPTEVRQDLDHALGGDPRSAVVAVRRLRVEHLPWLEERAIRLARSEGYSWAKLGRLLGRSRQAVRQRFGHVDGTPQPLQFRPTRDDQRIMARWNETNADVRRRQEFAALRHGDAVPW